MALRAHRSASRNSQSWRAVPSAAPRLPQPSEAVGDEAPVPSKAHELQDLVAAQFANDLDVPVEGRWHPAATLGFVVVTCGGFWAGVIVLLGRLF